MNTKIVLSCVLAQATFASATSLVRGGRNSIVEKEVIESPRRQRKAKSEKFKLFQEPVYEGIMKDLLIYETSCLIVNLALYLLVRFSATFHLARIRASVLTTALLVLLCFEECESICVGECVADTGSFLDVAVDRDLWCTEIECKTRIVEEDIADDDDGDDVRTGVYTVTDCTSDDGDDDDGDDDDGDDDDGDDDDGDDDDDSTPAPSPPPTEAPVTASPTITAPPVTESPTITSPPVTALPTTTTELTDVPTGSATTALPTTIELTDVPTGSATTALPTTIELTDAPTGWATMDDDDEDEAISMPMR
eukprot:scaffold41047_cov67-Cyclotella_meneghiniana.AAC.1